LQAPTRSVKDTCPNHKAVARWRIPHTETAMIARTLPCLLTALCLAPGQGWANDGFGGLSATGLTFQQTDAVAMLEEDLFIGLDEIRVDYVFKNHSAATVTGEVIFPLPPISLVSTFQSDWNLPDDLSGNFLGFTATVDGKDQPVTIDQIAVIEPPYDANAPLSAQYDEPGRDVTGLLAAHGLPLTLDQDAVTAALLALSESQRQKVADAGLAEYFAANDGTADEVYPNWSLVTRFHWTQEFAPGATLRISHRYDTLAPGGLFGWTHPAPDYMQTDVARFCIDEGTSRAMYKRLQNAAFEDGTAMGVAHYITYVLRTANSWSGPIGRFRLTIDKGAAENILSLCAEGVRKTGPTTFVIEKTDYVPDRDLELLIVSPFAPEN
jgi:hypothetical protein